MNSLEAGGGYVYEVKRLVGPEAQKEGSKMVFHRPPLPYRVSIRNFLALKSVSQAI